MLTIYHNTRCKKSRAGLEYLKTKGLDFKIVEYLKTPLTEYEIEELLKKLSIKPVGIIRKQESIYKSKFKGKEFSDAEWIKIISENPKLLQRPIVVNGEKAVLAQPPEEVEKIL